ncbi:hypothetical protein FACS1894188_05320 [Clostridia bacterium]|nr:hypothetical protein FACS1894188_05320 [Clostridia bacterium]
MPQVAVVNYESMWRLEPEITKWLMQDGGSLIIADESHKIKTHNTNAAKADYRLALTGTPIHTP